MHARVDRTAAQAALARVENQRHHDSVQFNTSLASIRAQVQRELEAERKAKTDLEKLTISEGNQPNTSTKVLSDENNLNLAAQGVYFR